MFLTTSNPVLHHVLTPRTRFARQSPLFTQVMEAAVIAVPHPKWTERPLLVVVAAPNSSLSRDVMLQFLQVRFTLEPRTKNVSSRWPSWSFIQACSDILCRWPQIHLPELQCYCTDGAKYPGMRLLALKCLLVCYTSVIACSSSVNTSSQRCAD